MGITVISRFMLMQKGSRFYMYTSLTVVTTIWLTVTECHHDLVNRYGMSVSQMTTDMLCLS